jgi:hypothetical protein
MLEDVTAVIKQTGRDRSGRAPRASQWSNFHQDVQDWTHLYDPDSAEATFPVTQPHQSNSVLNASAEYHVDDIARGGASGH